MFIKSLYIFSVLTLRADMVLALKFICDFFFQVKSYKFSKNYIFFEIFYFLMLTAGMCYTFLVHC